MRWSGWLLALGLIVTRAGAAQQPPDSLRGVQSEVRFQGWIPLQTPAGRDSAWVEIRNWMIRGGAKLDRLDLPKRGLLIVHLRAGQVTTIISGKRIVRQDGQVWTVPEGVVMGLETGREEAIIQTILAAGK